MRNILITISMFLMTSSVFAVVLIGEIGKTDHCRGPLCRNGNILPMLSTIGAATTISFNPVAGLVVLADNGVAEKLNLNNEDTKDEVEAIQLAIADGTLPSELPDFQYSLLMLGVNAGQLDMDGNILESLSDDKN